MSILSKMIREKDWDALTHFLVRQSHDHLVLSNNNPLHNACRIGAPPKVISRLLEIGGRDLLSERFTCRNGHNPLHYACMCKENTSLAVVSKLLEVGGRDLLFHKSRFGQNSLHCACRHRAPTEVILKLVEVGGKDLVLAEDNHGENSLHMAFCNNASATVILKLIEVGGDLVLSKYIHGSNILHRSYHYRSLSSHMLDLLVLHGGEEMLLQKSDHNKKTPLQKIITDKTRFHNSKTLIQNASLLINKGIEMQIGGEFAIGGLFDSTSNKKVEDEIYEQWDNLALPALKDVMKMSQNRDQPILHAAIISNASSRIIKDIVINFPESTKVIDSFGRYPVDVAVQRGLSWYGGLKEIIEAFILTEQLPTVFLVCARNGLPWENGMKTVAEQGTADDFEIQDEATNLYPFMLTALGGKHITDLGSLGSVFHLIQKSPQLVRKITGEGLRE